MDQVVEHASSLGEVPPDSQDADAIPRSKREDDI